MNVLGVAGAQAIGFGATEHVSRGAVNGNGAFGALFAGASAGGSRVFFSSGERLAGSDTGAATDIFAAAIDSAVTIAIAGGKLKLTRSGVAKVKLSCPAAEASPPCAGKLTLKTARKVAAGKGRKKKQTFAKASFSLGAGQAKSVTLKLNPAKLALVTEQRAARKAIATAAVADAAANKATVRTGLEPKPA